LDMTISINVMEWNLFYLAIIGTATSFVTVQVHFVVFAYAWARVAR